MAHMEEAGRLRPIRRGVLHLFLPRGLLGRSLIIIVAPLVLLQVVSAIIFYDRHWANVSRHRANAVASDLALIIELFHDKDGSVTRDWAFGAANRYLKLHVAYRPGKILANRKFVPSNNLERTLAGSLSALNLPFDVDTTSVPDRVLIDVQLPEGVLRVLVNDERLKSSTNRIFILWMVGTSLVLMGLAAIFMRNQVRPILRLAAAAENFGKGRDVSFTRPAGASEVRQAALAFIAMRERIFRQMQQRTEMLAGVSHDLRTPLTRMRLQLAMLERQPEIVQLEHEIIAMQAMIDGYLDFVRGGDSEKRQLADVRRLLEDVVGAARDKGGNVELESGGSVELPLAVNAFRRALSGLVANAMQHGKRVVVDARRKGGLIEITVDDDGPGIPETAHEDVFRPFFRLDESRGDGGPGLGLTIARDIVRSHGGNIVLGQSPLGGLRVLIQIPV